MTLEDRALRRAIEAADDDATRVRLRRMTDEEVAALSADERRELDKVAWFATHVYQPGQRARTSRNN